MKKQNPIYLILSALISIFILYTASQSYADDQTYFPPQLEPWVKWVKDRHPEWQCANFGQSRECLWDGKCSLEFKEKGLKFTLTGELLDRGSVRLVGSQSYPPSNVKVISGSKENSQNVKSTELIFENNSTYYINLPKGEFVVEGELSWDTIPQEIPVPDSYALIKVLGISNSNNQVVINNIKRSNNALWFKNEQQSADIDKVNLSVARKFTDGSPLMVETLLDLNISGSGRSVNFGKVIPNNSVVVGITSPLPYQLNSEGILSVQVSPGSYQITITSTMPQPVLQLKAESRLDEIWPSEETWVWVPNNNLRTISIDGGSALSADSTLIPQDWKNNAAYIVNPQEGLDLKELSRGDSSTNGNNLYLSRIMWLDLSGEGFTINDNFSGSFKNGERLNAEDDLKVGRVAIDSKPVLITEDPSSKKTGVEII